MTLTVLVVDDNSTDRYLLKRRLEKSALDTNVLEAENGQQALEVFSDYQSQREADPHSYPPLFVFLDINMPIMDGFGFLEAFHYTTAGPGFAPPTVVMFTSSHRNEDRERSMHWDFVKEYIVKGELTAEKLEELLVSHQEASRAA